MKNCTRLGIILSSTLPRDISSKRSTSVRYKTPKEFVGLLEWFVPSIFNLWGSRLPTLTGPSLYFGPTQQLWHFSSSVRNSHSTGHLRQKACTTECQNQELSRSRIHFADHRRLSESHSNSKPAAASNFKLPKNETLSWVPLISTIPSSSTGDGTKLLFEGKTWSA